MVKKVRPIGLVSSGAPLIAATVMPAEPDAFCEEPAVVVPAPRSFMNATVIATEWRSTADVAAPFVAAVRWSRPGRDALWPASAGMSIKSFAGIAVIISRRER